MRESLDEPERSAADGRVQLLRAPSRSGAWLPTLLAALDKETGRVRPSGAGPRARGARRPTRGCSRVAGPRGGARPGLLPQRGHRGARRLQGRVRVRRRRPRIAKLDGPLQDDAALALGKIGDKRALETLAALQRTAPRARAADGRRGDLPARRRTASRTSASCVETLKFARPEPGFQELLRGAAAGLGALGVGGRPTRRDALFEIGIAVARSRPRADRAGARRRSRSATRR